MMVVAPQVDEEGLTVTLGKVSDYVNQRGGVVVRQEQWGGVRRLAYPIKNYTEGKYILTHIELEPQDAQDLEAGLRLSEEVLRHMLLRVESIPEEKETKSAPSSSSEATSEVEVVAEVTSEAEVVAEVTSEVEVVAEATSEVEVTTEEDEGSQAPEEKV